MALSSVTSRLASLRLGLAGAGLRRCSSVAGAQQTLRSVSRVGTVIASKMDVEICNFWSTVQICNSHLTVQDVIDIQGEAEDRGYQSSGPAGRGTEED